MARFSIKDKWQPSARGPYRYHRHR